MLEWPSPPPQPPRWRRLLPFVAWGGATSSSLPDRWFGADGFYFGVQWFGLLVELNFYREEKQ